MFLWRFKKNYPIIITKYSSLTIPLEHPGKSEKKNKKKKKKKKNYVLFSVKTNRRPFFIKCQVLFSVKLGSVQYQWAI